MRRIRAALADLVGGAIATTPGGIGSRLRVRYFRGRGARIGNGVRIDPGVSIDNPHLVVIGDDTWLDRFAILIAGQPRPGRETRIVGDNETEIVGRIVIGSRCHIGPQTVLSGIGGLDIGDESTIAAGSKVYSLTHHLRSWTRPEDRSVAFGSQVEASRQSMLQGSVTIGRNVGVGVDCLILPGATIRDDSFVRPGSQVSGSWPENSVLAGRPAAREGERYSPNSG
ncbi:MAG: hypothetical protein HY262_02780 [Chloroflexi bacterium]|nr:hypothetical protein [Chloroflexota bacterium]